MVRAGSGRRRCGGSRTKTVTATTMNGAWRKRRTGCSSCACPRVARNSGCAATPDLAARRESDMQVGETAQDESRLVGVVSTARGPVPLLVDGDVGQPI